MNQLKKIFNLENFIFVVIIFLPTYLWRFSFFNLPTNFLEILIFIVFIWDILRLSHIYPGSNFKKIFPSFDLTSVLLISFILMSFTASVMVNGNYAVGFGIIKGWFIFPILLAILTHKNMPASKIYSAIYWSGFLTAISSMLFYFSHILTFDHRLQGFFNSPNYLAMYLAPAIIIQIITWLYQKEEIDSPKLLRESVVFIILFFVFYQTFSYAAWISVFVVCLFALFCKASSRWKYILLIVSAFIISSIIFSQWHTQKMQSLVHLSERSSLASRLMIWDSSWQIVRNHWFWGIGAGNFQEKYLTNQKNMSTPYLEWAVPHPHNLFLAMWLQAGIIGLFSFILLIAYWIKLILKQKKTLWQMIAMGIMFYFILHGLVDTTYFKNDLAILFWLNFIALL